MKLVVNGAENFGQTPGLEAAGDRVEIVFAPDEQTLGQALPGADILLGWDFRGYALAGHWARANQLSWIQWAGAGVNAVLFPELAASDVVLTNARGIYDTAMAEYVLAYMLGEAKDVRTTGRLINERRWQHRLTTRLAGQRALVFGVGSIGREIGRLARALGVNVRGVGRAARAGDDVFRVIHGQTDGIKAAGDADWIIAVMPSTAQTRDFFGADFFATMKTSARFINVGRGDAVDEQALEAALRGGGIAGALLDVFREEPLPVSSTLWDTPDLVISPHMSGDYAGFEADLITLFLDNLDRYLNGRPLRNVVDKSLGFVRG